MVDQLLGELAVRCNTPVIHKEPSALRLAQPYYWCQVLDNGRLEIPAAEVWRKSWRRATTKCASRNRALKNKQLTEAYTKSVNRVTRSVISSRQCMLT